MVTLMEDCLLLFQQETALCSKPPLGEPVVSKQLSPYIDQM